MIDRDLLVKIWEDHLNHEFVNQDTEATLSTMTEDAYVLCVPVLTGGYSKDGVRNFYGTEFIGKVPPDTKTVLISRTVGEDQIVDEMLFSFTHTEEIPFILPGVPPTNKYVEIALVAIIKFRDRLIASERIYWDQASVLKQIGLLTDPALPVVGIESAQKLPHLTGVKL